MLRSVSFRTEHKIMFIYLTKFPPGCTSGWFGGLLQEGRVPRQRDNGPERAWEIERATASGNNRKF